MVPETNPAQAEPPLQVGPGDFWAMVAAAFAILWAPLAVMLGGLALTVGLMYLWIMH